MSETIAQRIEKNKKTQKNLRKAIKEGRNSVEFFENRLASGKLKLKELKKRAAKRGGNTPQPKEVLVINVNSKVCTADLMDAAEGTEFVPKIEHFERCTDIFEKLHEEDIAFGRENEIHAKPLNSEIVRAEYKKHLLGYKKHLLGYLHTTLPNAEAAVTNGGPDATPLPLDDFLKGIKDFVGATIKNRQPPAANDTEHLRKLKRYVMWHFNFSDSFKEKFDSIRIVFDDPDHPNSNMELPTKEDNEDAEEAYLRLMIEKFQAVLNKNPKVTCPKIAVDFQTTLDRTCRRGY